jgi:hypothetical protein
VALLGLTLFIVASFALASTDGGRRRLSLLDDEHASDQNIIKRLYRSVAAAIDAAFSRGSRAKGLAHSLDAAGIALKPGELALLVALAVMGALVVGLASGEPMLGLLLAVGAIAFPGCSSPGAPESGVGPSATSSTGPCSSSPGACAPDTASPRRWTPSPPRRRRRRPTSSAASWWRPGWAGTSPTH